MSSTVKQTKINQLGSERVSDASLRCSVTIPLLGGAVSGELMTFIGLNDGREHLAVGFGDWREKSQPLVRIHSECLTGDVFGSSKCDCGDQLHEAIARLSAADGILLYLRQEGRDIGLYNKLDAYALQSCGLDTYEANRALNLPDDLRDYQCAAEMLGAMGVSRISLLSNNPNKGDQLARFAIDVAARVPTGVFMNEHNRSYLEAKVRFTNHTIDLLAQDAPVNAKGFGT